MRVLHTIATLDPATGGPARSVPNLAIALGRQGVEVALWTPGAQQESWLAPLQAAGIQTCCGDLGSLAAFDLIHDHGVWLMNNHRLAAHAAAEGIPRVVSPRGMLEPWALKHKKWKKRAAWWLYQRRDLNSAHALHATAESEAAQFRELGLKAPVIVLPNGVDLVKAGTLETETLKVDMRTALFLSRIHPKKGLPLLVEAWARVRPAGWRMVVVGPDEDGHRAAVETMVRKAGIADQWRFENALDDDAKWLALSEADLMVLPTYSENFGIVVAEALASGTPVITTTGTPWQGLHGHRCGWWVEPAVATLSAALAQATRLEASELAAMGGRGRKWMQNDFAWPGIASRMAGAYGGILAGAPLPVF